MQYLVNVKVKKLAPNATIPEYKSKGAAGFDLSTTEDILIPANSIDNVNLIVKSIEPLVTSREPFLINDNSAIAGTGLSFEIPEGYELEIRGRSGNAFKYRVFSFNGTIDSDYRGEIKLLLMNFGSEDISFGAGDRVAQGVIKKIEQASFFEVEELGETERGSGGFGHTGTN